MPGLPEPEFKEEFGCFSVCFYKDIYTEEVLKKTGLKERQIKAVIFVKENGRITNKEYRNITGLSDEGARIDFSELVKKNSIKKVRVVIHIACLKCLAILAISWR